MTSSLPKTLGRYQILEEIGKGAMGVVYLARDPAIGRLVALKTFRIGDVGESERAQYRERFMREARSAGILSHPNIVTIHDFVEDAEAAVTFIAMEFIRGTDLKELLRRDEPFDLTFIANVVWQVAEALEYAHTKGVVHRDIKPANILITGDDRVKLTDFGIARLTDPGVADLTHAGQLLGTPNYMAPEQLLGKEINHQADIFALGVVLYEMLTRHKPFAGDNLTVVSQRILHDAFTPPEQYVGELPPGLGAVLSRALAKEPAERYQRVGELARDLKAVADQASIRGHRGPSPEGAVVSPVSPVSSVSLVPPVPPAPGGSLPPGVSVPRPEAAPGPLSRWREIAAPLLAPLAARLLPPRDRRPPPWRYAAVAAASLLLTLSLGLGAIAWVSPEDTAAQDAARDREIAHRFRYLPWVWMGRSLLDRGEAVQAAAAFSEAERRAPGEVRLRELREEAERRAAAEVEQARREAEAAVFLDTGEEALSRRRYQEAEEAANQALALLPAEPRALSLLARAREAQERRRGGSPGRPITARGPLPATEAPAAPATPTPQARSPEPAPAPRFATLQVVFRTQRSEGVLTLYAGEQQLLREPFRFTRRRSFFRTEEVSGGFERTLEIAPGQSTLRVYVALDRTVVESVQGNFPAGLTRVLEVDVDGSGKLEIKLR